MKTFEGKATWTASEWGEETPDCVVVSGPGSPWLVPHEDQIERVIPGAPDDLKRYVRGEVLRCRPTAENEKRQDGDSIAQFRLRGGKMERRFLFVTCTTVWGSFHFDVDDPPNYLSAEDLELYSAARAWRDRQWQDVEGAEGWEVQRTRHENVRVRFNRCLHEFTANHLRANTRVTHHRAGPLPEPVIRACCKLLGVEREVPLADNELVLRGKVRKMRMASPEEDYSAEPISAPKPGEPAVIIDHGGEGCAPYTRAELEALARCNDNPRGWSRALEFLDKHAPKLADNQMYCYHGSVTTLRWHNGEAEYQNSRIGEDWRKWRFGNHSKSDAWFRANCPIDRFVTDRGHVLKFRMRDDGEAEAISWSTGGVVRRTDIGGTYDPLMRNLVDFRDTERAKWRFQWGDYCGRLCRKPAVRIYKDSDHRGWFAGGGAEQSASFSGLPQWVRAKAEAMWREREATRKVTFEAIPRDLLTQLSNTSDDEARTTVDLHTFSKKDCDALRSIARDRMVRFTIETVESEGT